MSSSPSRAPDEGQSLTVGVADGPVVAGRGRWWPMVARTAVVAVGTSTTAVLSSTCGTPGQIRTADSHF